MDENLFIGKSGLEPPYPILLSFAKFLNFLNFSRIVYNMFVNGSVGSYNEHDWKLRINAIVDIGIVHISLNLEVY